ncbi:MAG: type II secretion system F family protein [Spirochaetales bacterium]|nr:type II secretion system F family protein [Spirochaetales bacterium]
MPLYNCKLADNTGKTIQIIKEAPNEESLILELMQQKFSPLKIREIKSKEETISTGKRFSQTVILEFTETLSLLLSSGLSLKDALDVIKTIFTKGPVNKLTNTLVEKIKKGDSFHQALDKYSTSFPPLYRGLVKIGQKIGSLETIFARLADYLRESKKIKDKLMNALSNPLMTIGFAIACVVGMAVFIFPRLKDIFSQLQADVSSQITNSMAMVNTFFVFGGIFLVFLIIFIIAVYFIRRSTGPLRLQLDKLLLRIPIFGKILYLQESLNFLFAMETLTGSGFAVEDALPEAGKVLSNMALSSGIDKIRQRVIKGDHLSTSFLNDPFFEERIGRWMSIGERSGKVDLVFGQLRQYYQEEMDKWSTRFMGVVEPMLTVFVGIIIIGFIFIFFLPIFSIYQAIQY